MSDKAGKIGKLIERGHPRAGRLAEAHDFSGTITIPAKAEPTPTPSKAEPTPATGRSSKAAKSKKTARVKK